MGLTLNGAKTKIISPQSLDHPAKKASSSTALERIDSILGSKKKPLVAIAFSEIREKLEKLISENQTDDRSFRFYTHRICRLALCEEISKPPDFFSSITAKIISLLDEQPQSSDKYIEYLMAAPLSADELGELANFFVDPLKSIYSWQKYLLWKLFVYKDYKTQALIDHASLSINPDTKIPHLAGSLLYIGKFGTPQEKTKILTNFIIFNNPFSQRHALIAIQEIKWKEAREFISPYIRDESRGTYRTLSGRAIKTYIERLEPIKYTELIEGVTFYE
jgi:hypothetical protein